MYAKPEVLSAFIALLAVPMISEIDQIFGLPFVVISAVCFICCGNFSAISNVGKRLRIISETGGSLLSVDACGVSFTDSDKLAGELAGSTKLSALTSGEKSLCTHFFAGLTCFVVISSRSERSESSLDVSASLLDTRLERLPLRSLLSVTKKQQKNLNGLFRQNMFNFKRQTMFSIEMKLKKLTDPSR